MVIVGALMMVYVLFGGMTATTWVQIIKACLLLGGATFMAFMVLWQLRLQPGGDVRQGGRGQDRARGGRGQDAGGGGRDRASRSWGRAASSRTRSRRSRFGMALMFGTAGLPHILMRFFTVPSAKEARKSVMWATTWIGYFYLLTFIIGFGAITFVLTNPEFLDAKGAPDRRRQHGGRAPGQRGRRQRLPRLHLGGGVRDHPRGRRRADAVGRVGRVARPVRDRDQEGQGRQRGRAAGVADHDRRASASLAVLLGIVFEKQNIAFMVSLAFAIAASANFPVLFMSVLWKDCTTSGAVIGGFLGLISSVVLTIALAVGLGSDARQPEGLGAVPLHLAGAVLDDARLRRHLAVLDPRPQPARAQIDRAGFVAQQVRSETGIGASQASGH